MPNLTPEKERLLDTKGHILALGGPGSGKTFIALLKADREIKKQRLQKGQRILFLSFARATIARVAQQAGTLISGPDRKTLEITTYHGFAWNLLQCHGYLLNTNNRIRLLPPPEAASRLSEIHANVRSIEKSRLFQEEGLLHFDLFAAIASKLLSKSQALTRIICDAYPTIILDEFQDTNMDEWQMIKTLGRYSRLIALADAEQRIYEFRGADPRRIGEFITTYSPTQFDFSSENHRNNGTDIAVFGNDLLTEANKTKTYKDVLIVPYGFYRGRSAHYSLKTTLLKGIERLKSNKNNWSIAILVPTKRLMLAVSDYFSAKVDGLPSIHHDVALDTEGPALAAVLLAGLLERSATKAELAQRFILDLCTHIRGHNGNTSPSQSVLQIVRALEGYLNSMIIKGTKRKLIVDECYRIASEVQGLTLSGDPWEDWLTVRKLLADSATDMIRQVSEDAKYLRLLHRGAVLRSRLSDLWRTNGSYIGAAAAVRAALLQEHFSISIKEWRGIHVMTMHKSKGKEFDEVFIYEGSHQGRIIRSDASPKDGSQALLTLRVAVTRAKKRTTILTPKQDVCKFFVRTTNKP